MINEYCQIGLFSFLQVSHEFAKAIDPGRIQSRNLCRRLTSRCCRVSNADERNLDPPSFEDYRRSKEPLASSLFVKVVADHFFRQFAHQLSENVWAVDGLPVPGCADVRMQRVEWRDNGFAFCPGRDGRTLNGIPTVNREHSTRSLCSTLVQCRTDSSKAPHLMEMRWVFRQILPMGIELGVSVGYMKDADSFRIPGRE